MSAGWCAEHQRAERQRFDTARGSASSRGYGSHWRQARALYLADHPLCECTEHRGRDDSPPATVVDHVIPHRGDTALFWDSANWRAMAKPCHDRKTAREDGRWGRRQ